MHSSTVTSKGQTTIPKEVRELLHLKPRDKIVYIPDGNRVFLAPVNGTILNLKGVVKRPRRGPVDFARLRHGVKKKVAQEALEEMK